jgi:fibronectin type 3 domain-containing protein
MIDYKRKLKIAISVVMVAAFLVTSLLAVAVDVTASGSEAPLSGDGLGAVAVPSAPRNLDVDQGPGFNWLWWEHPVSQGSDLIKTYEIWRGDTSGGETQHDWVYVGSTEYEGTYLGGLEFYNDSTDIVLDTEYFYQIVAVSDAGSSAPSNEATATPSMTGDTPNAPTVTGLNGIYSADLSWNWPSVPAGSPPARFFFTYRDPVMFWSTAWDEWLRVTSASDEAGFFTQIGVSYTYTVRAVNTYGQGAEGTATVIIQGTGNLPSAARNLTAWGLNNSVMLWWDYPANPSAIGFDGYEVYRATNSAGPFTKINETDVFFGYGGFYSDDEVTNGVTYWYKVRAFNTNGVGEYSNVVEATPNEYIPPFEISYLDAYPGNNQVLLLWSSAYGATGNDIYRSESSGTETLLTSIGASSYYFDTTALNGHTYFYYVKPKKGSTVGPASEEASASPSAGTVPAAATGVVATPDTDGAMVYVPQQTVSSMLIGYEIYRNGTTPGSWQLADTEQNFWAEYGFSWLDSGRIPDVNYQYAVKLKNLYGTGPSSDAITSFGSPTGERPDAVGGLTATGQPGKVHLQWSAPYMGTATLITYEIERNDTDGTWDTVGYLDTTATSLAWDDEWCLPGVTYQYKVLAVNNYGDADSYSNVASGSATPATSAPSAPLGLSAQNHIGQVVLSWAPPASAGSSPITGYKVFRGTTSGGQGATPIATVGAAAVSYTDNVAAGTYYYTVKAVNAVGDSPASNEVAGTSTAAQPPGAPTNLAAAGHNGYVILTWDAPSSSGSSSVIRYDVFRGTTAGSIGATPIGNVLVGTLTYNDTTVTNGQAYFYQVKAVNNEGSSPASNTATATPSGPSAPTAPRNLAAMGHDGYVILTWDAPTSPGTSAITRYDVFRGASAGSIGTTPIGNVAAGTLTYNDTTVTNGDTYYYVVKAVNDVGSSPASNTAQATPSQAGTAPGAPTNLNAVGQVGAIVLTWDAPSQVGSGVTSYLIFRATTSNGQGTTPLATVSGGQLTYTDSSAVVGTPYFYKVKASNSFGDSAFSNEDSATATEQPSGTPSYPQNLVATPGEGKVTLIWQAPADDGGSDITGYKVYRRQAEGAASLLGTVDASTLTYVDTTGTVGATYSYFVVATNANGAGAESATVNAASQEGGGGGGTDNTMLYIGIAVVAIIAIAAIAFLMMRRKK